MIQSWPFGLKRITALKSVLECGGHHSPPAKEEVTCCPDCESNTAPPHEGMRKYPPHLIGQCVAAAAMS
jgi:hypothetical protein